MLLGRPVAGKTLQSLCQTRVAGGQAIPKTQAAQKQILDRPRADSPERTNLPGGLDRRHFSQFCEIQLFIRRGTGGGQQIFGLRTGKFQLPERIDVQFRHGFGRRVGAQSGGMDRSRRQDQFPPQRDREAQVDLLTDNRPRQRFPGRRGQRNAQATLPTDGRAQQRIGAEVPFKSGGIGIEPQHPDGSGVRGIRIRGIRVAGNGLAGEAKVQNRRLVSRENAFPHAVFGHALAAAFRVASIKIQDRTRPVSARQTDAELPAARPQTGVGARSQSGLRDELFMEGRRALETRRGGRIGRFPALAEQPADLFHPQTPQEGPGRFVRMVAKQVVERRAAHARDAAQRSHIPDRGGVLPDLERRLREEALVPLRASIKEIRPAAEAGPQPGLFGFHGCAKEAHVFAPGPAGGTGRQAVDAGGDDAREELAVQSRIPQQKLPEQRVVIPSHTNDGTENGRLRSSGNGRSNYFT